MEQNSFSPTSTNTNDLKEQFQKLKTELLYHNQKYYTDNNPEISDKEYDNLCQQYQQLESQYPNLAPKDSPLKQVGATPDKFTKEKHRLPMLSLANTYNLEEIVQFEARIIRKLKTEHNTPKLEYFIEPKYDGIGISLVYEKGQLIKALTRGDGTTGEVVTNNVLTIKDIPHTLNNWQELEFNEQTLHITEIEIRGEIVMPKASFEQLNEMKIAAEEEPFANPRNATAGSIKVLDPNITKARNLSSFLYQIARLKTSDNQVYSTNGDNSLNLSTWQEREIIQQLGLQTSFDLKIKQTNTNFSLLTSDPSEIIEFAGKVEAVRNEIPVEIDGLVIYIN